MKTYVCDWTHWQEIPCPADRIQTEGYGMVKVKAGGASREGRYYEDPLFQASMENVLGTGMEAAAYWYLMPGRPFAQAGLFTELINGVSVPTRVHAFLDVEEPGLIGADVTGFAMAWAQLTGRQLNLYTSKRTWQTLGVDPEEAAEWFPFLEEAHWVPSNIRNNSELPYASQQVKAIEPEWWTVKYGAWEVADMIQFSDNVRVQGKRTTASVFMGTRSELRTALGG